LYHAKQVELLPGERVIISGINVPIPVTDWCEEGRFIPAFQGPIRSNAKYLIIRFDNFGPFDGFEVAIRLK
jgi:hypothetical protein